MRNRYFIAADLVLIVCAAIAAFALRFDLLVLSTRPELWVFLGAALVLKPVVFFAFGFYRRYWPAASVGEFVSVLGATVVNMLALGLFVTVAMSAGTIAEFSRSVLVIDALLSLVLTGGVRFMARLLSDSTRRSKKAYGRRATDVRRVIIVGAGEAGVMVAREAQRNPQLGLRVVGFLDDDEVKQGKRIAEADVLGPLPALERVVTEREIGEVIIALPTAPGRTVRDLVETCRRLHVRSRTVPGVFELLAGGVSIRRLRDIQITDLLRRHPVRRDLTAANYLTDRVVLVTGAGGSVGSELCRQVAASNPSQLILLGHGENSIFDVHGELRLLFPNLDLVPVIADVRDGRRLRQVFGRHRPHIVFHAAAHKHVPLMEANPEEAITNNVIGTARVIDAAMGAGADRFVLVSTDKAVSPSSVMGASKRIAEHLVHAAASHGGCTLVLVRFGNVLGSRGSVVPIFTRQIERGGPLTVTHPDMRRYFMTIPEAAHLILEAGGFGESGSAYVLNMGDPVKVVDLARDLIRLSGADEHQVSIEFTGLRPGEKLTEELWEDDARVSETSHPDVFRLSEPDRPGLDEEARRVLALVASDASDVPPPAVAHLVEVCQGMVTETPSRVQRRH